MLRLSQAGDYAIRGVLFLASHEQGKILLVRGVAEERGIPRAFLAKIFQILARAGVLKSHQGSGGGFSLARPATEISLLEVVEAIEGSILLHECILNQPCERCGTPGECVIGSVWGRAQENMVKVLRETTIADMMERIRLSDESSNSE